MRQGIGKNISKIAFKGIPQIDIKKLLTILEETYDKSVDLRMRIKTYMESRWYDKYEYRYKHSKSNTFIAFYSDFYYRQDHFTIFRNFIKEFPEFDYVLPVKKPEKHRNIRRGFKMLKWDIYNMWQLRNVDEPIEKKIYLIQALGLVGLYSQKMCEYLEKKTYSYGLVYSDTTPSENVLVRVMKQKGIRTATLQHGIFDKRGYWKGLEFRASVADDWLAWNLYSKELAMECGIREDNIKVLGIPRYIIPICIERKGKKGVFSVILGGMGSEKENQKLIEFANLLAEEQGIKYFLRYHPTSNVNDYNMYTNTKLCIRRNRRGETVRQMCERSDFSLVGSGTSMVIDLIYLRQPFMQYYKEWDGKPYKGRENYFNTYEKLKIQLEKELKIENNEMFDYYCTTMDVKHSYAQYFDLL